MKNYYKKDLFSPLKKKSARTRLAIKICSWTHRTSFFLSRSTSYTYLNNLSSILIGSNFTQLKFVTIEPTSFLIFCPSDSNFFVSSDFSANVISADNFYSSILLVMVSKSDNALSSTFSDTSFSSNASVLTLSSFYFFTLLMPQLGVLRSPWFDGTNVTEFLDRYSNLCRNYHISDKKIIQRML